MNRIQRLNRAKAGSWRWPVVAWIVFGIALWIFLTMPYAVAAFSCRDEGELDKTYQCLKLVARDLRNDPNIATYATATVAAIIALQLANRNRVDASRRDSSLDK